MGNCLYCNRELTGLQRKFCSKSCKQKSYSPNFGTPAYRPLPERTSDYCSVCSKPLTGRQTVYCSRKCKLKDYEHSSYPTQKKRGLNRKLKLIARRGGECQSCGYNKNLGVLTFHHKYDKKFTLNRHDLARMNPQTIEAELEKCDLFCANCHLELHNPTLDITVIQQTQQELQITARKSINQTPGLCTICGKTLTGKQQRYCSRGCLRIYHNTVHQNYYRQKQKGLQRKLELIAHFGGKCSHCGYNKNLAALVFHHLDPAQKDHNLDLRSLSNRSLQSVLQEFEKCQLLCENCHRELHHPDLEMTQVSSKYAQ